MHGNKDIANEFMNLVQTHQGILHKVCFAYGNQGISREDLYQEIVLQLWKSFSGFKAQSKFSTWMYRVALNTAISQTRRSRIFVDLAKAPTLANDPEPAIDLSEEIKQLYTAICYLNKVEKALVLLWLEELSYEEIAITLGISVKNVSVRLVRIKKKLAEILKSIE